MESFVTYLTTGIVFFIIFSVIILIHEGGHFWAARFGGIGIEEFGFGLPPRAWGKKNKKSGVLYSINWIPFGGFVRMLGEDEKEASKNPAAFQNRPLWARIFAVSAGVLMNFLLGWFLLFLGFLIGMKPFTMFFTEDEFNAAIEEGIIETEDRGVFINSVLPGSPAEKAGLQGGDIILAIDNVVVETADGFTTQKEKGLRGKAYHLTITRKELEKKQDGKMKENFIALVTPDEEGMLGVSISDDDWITGVNTVQYGVVESAVVAGQETWRLSRETVKMFAGVVKKIVSSFSVPEQVGGPIAIAQQTHFFVTQEAKVELLKWAALLSISIAVINIMPLPALDGGRLLFLLIELVIFRPVSQRFESVVHGFGFLLLLTLLVLVSYQDILRIFS